MASKGGVGKSTLTACIAAAAAKSGTSVYILDKDPQQSTAAWWRRSGAANNPLLIEGVNTVSEAAQRLRAKGLEEDLLIVDTPGSFLDVINEAIRSADVIILVTQPSGKDLHAVRDAEMLIERASAGGRTIYVVNRADKRSLLTRDTVTELRRRGLRGEAVIISDRSAYNRADQYGRTGPDDDKQAAAEIDELWRRVQNT